MAATPYVFFPFALLFVTIHAFAQRTNLYWFLPWLDVVMHTTGGFLGVYGLLMLGRLGSRRLQMGPGTLALALFAAMVLWEVFEYFYVVDVTQPHFVRDTFSDLFAGAVGGVVAYWAVKK